MQDSPTFNSLHELGALAIDMTRMRDIDMTEASVRVAAHYGEMHRQQRTAKRRLLARRAVAYFAATLTGAALALAIHDAPAKIAATVLDAQRGERW